MYKKGMGSEGGGRGGSEVEGYWWEGDGVGFLKHPSHTNVPTLTSKVYRVGIELVLLNISYYWF